MTMKPTLDPADINAIPADRLFITASKLCAHFGLTGEQLLAELRAGRLIAHGRATATGYDNLCFRVDNIARWLARPGNLERCRALVGKPPN